MSDYEKRVIEFESARNEAANKFFEARKHLERNNQNESFFEQGFRMAWELNQSRNNELEQLRKSDVSRIEELSQKFEFEVERNELLEARVKLLEKENKHYLEQVGALTDERIELKETIEALKHIGR